MKPAAISHHARNRINERCELSESEVRQILDAGAGITIQLQKGGRYAHRLIYSYRDKGWFVVVQDGGDGGVLTVMPLDYLKGRTSVTAAQKRQARRKAIDAFDKAIAPANAPVVEASIPARAAAANQPVWRIRVRYMLSGKLCFKTLPRVPEHYGDPRDWVTAGPIHEWFKIMLIEAEIPFRGIESVVALSKKHELRHLGDFLMHLSLTDDEMDTCR